MVELTEIEADNCALLLRKGSHAAAFLGSGKCVIVTVAGTDVVEALKKACGNISFKISNQGTKDIALAALDESAAQDLDEFAFGALRPLKHWPTARYGPESTCCVIRPHAIVSKQLGAIISHIEETGAYELSAIGLFKLDVPSAAEFLEVYEGVIPEFEAAVKQLSSGPCCALELQASDAVNKFRETAGPWDVNFATEIRPKTIRAQFGVDSVKNAVHCTDLPDDGETEIRYFFDVLVPC